MKYSKQPSKNRIHHDGKILFISHAVGLKKMYEENVTYVSLIGEFQVNSTCYIYIRFEQNIHPGLQGTAVLKMDSFGVALH